MKIKSMTATFGKLDNARLELGERLNLIHAPNEGGKSTWAAFWRAMLYGIDTRDRDKKNYLADKNRYQPWSGAPMAGELTVEWQGRDITIRRGPRGSVPFGSFSAVYAGTEEPVPGLTAANCGEMLTGVGLEVFTRSAFLGGDLSLTTAPELERRIAALVSSGEEGVSFTQVQGRLKDWLNKRRVNKSVGELPRLEGELAQVRAELADLEEVTALIARLEGERAGLERQHDALTAEAAAHRALARRQVSSQIAQLEGQLALLEERKTQLQEEEDLHRRAAQHALNRRYGQAHQEWETAQAQLAALEGEAAKYGALPDRELLKRAQGELQYLKVLDEEIKAGEDALKEAEEAYVQAQIAAQDARFAGLTGAEALHRAEEDTRAYEQARASENQQKKRGRSLQIASSLIVIATALVNLTLRFPDAFRIPALALLAGAVVCQALSCGTGRRQKRAAREAAQLLARYETTDSGQILRQAQDYAARCSRAGEAAQRSKSVRGALSDRKARRENGWTDVLTLVHSFAPEVQNAFGCSAALSRALNWEHDLAAARDRVEERRRRLDDLAAQGGQLADTLELLPAPSRTLEETRADLADTAAQLERTAQALNQARGRRDAMDSGDGPAPVGQEFPVPEHTPEETAQALADTQGRLEQVSAQLNQAQGRQRAMGDPAALAARLEQLEQAHARRTLEYAALALAMDTMQGANARLQERFSPELNALAGQYLARLTGDKYAAVSLTRELEGSVRREGDVLPRSALYLSRGTADQLYLAVRLAVCRLCLPEKPPILLDDALAAFDDGRLKLALGLLRELAREQQLLLFTCQKREVEELAGAEDVTRLAL